MSYVTIVGFQYVMVVLTLIFISSDFSVEMLYYTSPCVYQTILFATVANLLFIHPVVWSSHSLLYCLIVHPHQFREVHPLMYRAVLAKADELGVSDCSVF